MLHDSALVIAGNAVEAAITHLQLHTGDPGPAGTANVIAGTRKAVDGTVDADGDITWSNVSWTGLSAGQPVSWVSYWTASSGGTCHGRLPLAGDAAANAAGEFNIVSLTESNAAA